MVDLDVLITGLVGLVTTIVSSGTSWFFARRKYNSEVDLNLVDKMEKSLEFYKTLSDDNTARLEELTRRNAELSKEVQDLKNQIYSLAVNICMDLTCANRIRETYKKGKYSSKSEEVFIKDTNETSSRKKMEKK